MEGIHSRFIALASGLRLHYLDNGNGNCDDPVFLLIHGWPSLAYSWRHQLRGLAERGIRAIACDNKGFGGSDKPLEREAYTQEALVKDVRLFMDAVGFSKFVVIGHDWGGVITWNLALTQDERILAAGAICTPFYPYVAGDPMESLKRSRAFNYQVYFQDGETAARELDEDKRQTFAAIFRTKAEFLKNATNKNVTERGGFLVGLPDDLPGGVLFSDSEVIEAYLEGYKSGFFTTLRVYQNYPENAEYRKTTRHVKLKMPCLMITASHDFILKPKHSYHMEDLIDNLTRRNVEASHWAMEEKPQQVTSHLVDFFDAVANKSKL